MRVREIKMKENLMLLLNCFFNQVMF